MAGGDGDAEARGDRLERVGGLVRLRHARQQQGVEQRLVKAQAGRGLLELQEAHVEGDVVADQHGVGGEGVEGRQHLGDPGLAAHHLRPDAVERDRRLGDAAAGIDELVEALAAQEPAVDDPHRAHLDDLVAAGRVEAGRLGVEHRAGEPLERPVV